MIKFYKRGEGTILTMFLVVIVLTLILLVADYLRLCLLQQEVEFMLQRGVNTAVEYAMGDSYRQDKLTHLDVDAARAAFDHYLHNEAGLDADNQMIKHGQAAYTLAFSEISGTTYPARLAAMGTLQTKGLFFAFPVSLPFRIESTNFRVD